MELLDLAKQFLNFNAPGARRNRDYKIRLEAEDHVTSNPGLRNVFLFIFSSLCYTKVSFLGGVRHENTHALCTIQGLARNEELHAPNQPSIMLLKIPSCNAVPIPDPNAMQSCDIVRKLVLSVVMSLYCSCSLPCLPPIIHCM